MKRRLAGLWLASSLLAFLLLCTFLLMAGCDTPDNDYGWWTTNTALPNPPSNTNVVIERHEHGTLAYSNAVPSITNKVSR